MGFYWSTDGSCVPHRGQKPVEKGPQPGGLRFIHGGGSRRGNSQIPLCAPSSALLRVSEGSLFRTSIHGITKGFPAFGGMDLKAVPHHQHVSASSTEDLNIIRRIPEGFSWPLPLAFKNTNPNALMVPSWELSVTLCLSLRVAGLLCRNGCLVLPLAVQPNML